MKRIVSFIENNVSLVLTLGVPLGLIFPYFSFLKNYITYFLMIVLFITFLKIDFTEVIKHVKRPVLLLYICLMQLILIPVIVFLVLKLFRADASYLAALLLFSAIPAGAASSAITELTHGDTPFSVVLTVVTHFLSTVTIPLLFFILLKKVIHLDYLGVFITMVKLIIIPLGSALIFKKLFKNLSDKISERSRLLTVFPLWLISFTVISVNHNFIVHNPWETIKYILVSYPFYFFFLIAGYLVSFKLSLKEKIAVSTTKTFMNVTIGIVLALSFLSPTEALIMTMAQIPWSTMILPAELVSKFLYKRKIS
jgi:BASS family bile acid:Na+ symporter